MNLDEVADTFKAESDTPELQHLGEILLEWKEDDSTVTELDERVESCLDEVQIDEATLLEARSTWDSFQEKIKNIGGMTMNERLYHFSLFSRYEDGEEDIVHDKLLASR